MQTNVFSQTKRGRDANPVNALSSFSRVSLPANIEQMFDWGEWLWLRCGEYSKAVDKLINYFLVDVEVLGDVGYATKKKYSKYLLKDLKIMERSYTLGRDLFTYGNAFASMLTPFVRTLHCPKCGSSFPSERVDYTLSAGKFKGRCLKCKSTVTFHRRDTPDKGSKLRIIRWDPRDIHIEYNQITEDCVYYYTPNSTIIAGIQNGDHVYLDNTPWKIIKAVLGNSRIKMDPGKLKHMKYDGIASLKSKLKGWGVPPFFAAFDQIVLLNLLKYFNEAVITDFLVPFRFLSPPKGGETNDPLIDIDAGQFMASVRDMIAEQRADPTKMHSIPYPVQYQAIGGEAKALAPADLMEFTLNNLYNTLGIPVEFTTTNLQSGGPPIGLRMFERQHSSYFNELSGLLDWVRDELSDKEMWEGVDLRFKKVSVVEDTDTKLAKRELLASNKVSNDTALSPLGVDYFYEMDKIQDEQEYYDELMMKSQRSAQLAGEMQGVIDTPLQQPQDPNAQGGQPQGAPPPAGGGGGPGGAVGPGGAATLDSLNQQADEQAQQIMTMDPSTRKSTLIQMGKDDEELHALVMQKIKKLEQAAAQNGLNMTRQGQIPPPGQQG